MKRSVLSLLLFLLICSTRAFSQEVRMAEVGRDSVWQNDVRSIYFTRSGLELEAPVLQLGGSERLVLHFDLLGLEPKDLRYRITHCDADWHPDLPDPYDYISGFEEENINNYESSFTTLQPYFHYHQTLPSRNTRFLVSGNYLLSVFIQDEPDSILFTRRFYVEEHLLDADIEITPPKAGIGNPRRDVEVDVSLGLAEGKILNLSPQFLTVRVQQNRRTDLVRTLSFSGYNGSMLAYRWQNENVFPGGNCFRYFDISNLHTPMYNVQKVDQYADELFAFIRPEQDRSRKNYSHEEVLRGGMKTNAFDRHNPHLEGDYVWVSFSLPLEQPFLDGSVHIVGQLTDWELTDRSRMEWQPQYKAYTARMLLKQGYYAYQLLFLRAGEMEAVSYKLEGDHYETHNDYTIYVYYHFPNDRSDRLILVHQLKQ